MSFPENQLVSFTPGITDFDSAILLFLLAGVGEMYAGKMRRGIVILLARVILAAISMGIGYFVIWLLSIYDGYKLRKENRPRYVLYGNIAVNMACRRLKSSTSEIWMLYNSASISFAASSSNRLGLIISQ